MLLKISAVMFLFGTLCADSTRGFCPGGRRSFDTFVAQIAQLEMLASSERALTGVGLCCHVVKCIVAALPAGQGPPLAI